MIGGNYERGPHRGGGQMVNSLECDRVRALQLMQQAMPLAQQDDQKTEVAGFFLSLADQLLYHRGYNEAWRLQYLTDLSELPDYEVGHPYFRDYNGAPVDADGKPVFHQLPKSWQDAETDGQRWSRKGRKRKRSWPRCVAACNAGRHSERKTGRSKRRMPLGLESTLQPRGRPRKMEREACLFRMPFPHAPSTVPPSPPSQPAGSFAGSLVVRL
jgi:hypothetical protein